MQAELPKIPGGFKKYVTVKWYVHEASGYKPAGNESIWEPSVWLIHQLLTDEGSPIYKLIEAARPFRGNGDINEALIALEVEKP